MTSRAHDLLVVAMTLGCTAIPAAAATNIFTEVNAWKAFVAQEELVLAEDLLLDRSEGEFGWDSLYGPEVFSHLGFAVVSGINPYMSINGVQTGDTRVFFDRDTTFNTYGQEIVFEGDVTTSNSQGMVIRPVLLDRNGRPMSPNGALETGYLYLAPEGGMRAFGVEIIDSEVAFGTKLRFRFGPNDGDYIDEVFFAQAGAPGERRFYGFTFSEPVTSIFILLGAHWENDGAVIGGLWTGVEPTAPECNGDANGDGRVDVLDLHLVLGNWGHVSASAGDVTADGRIDIDDLNIVIGNFGSTCGPLDIGGGAGDDDSDDESSGSGDGSGDGSADGAGDGSGDDGSGDGTGGNDGSGSGGGSGDGSGGSSGGGSDGGGDIGGGGPLDGDPIP